MEAGKRKRSATSDGAARVQKSARSEPAASPVDDAAVDEFFAILRRMREASSKCLRGAAARPSGDGGAKWKPAFVWEDFEGGDAACGGGGDDKAEDRSRRCLDLNADPEPEGR